MFLFRLASLCFPIFVISSTVPRNGFLLRVFNYILSYGYNLCVSVEFLSRCCPSGHYLSTINLSPVFNEASCMFPSVDSGKESCKLEGVEYKYIWFIDVDEAYWKFYCCMQVCQSISSTWATVPRDRRAQVKIFGSICCWYSNSYEARSASYCCKLLSSVWNPRCKIKSVLWSCSLTILKLLFKLFCNFDSWIHFLSVLFHFQSNVFCFHLFNYLAYFKINLNNLDIFMFMYYHVSFK